jgi:hypothetical protein
MSDVPCQIEILITGYMPAIALNIIARLDIADQIAQEPKAIADLATVTQRSRAGLHSFAPPALSNNRHYFGNSAVSTE